MPEGAAPDAGDHRHDVPTNLSVETTLNRSSETTKNRNSSFPDDGFEQFWKLYPDKKGKQYCQGIWERRIEGKADFEAIITAAIERGYGSLKKVTKD